MKPVLIVDRDRLGRATALQLLDRCRIPAMAAETLEEAFGFVEAESDGPAAVLVDLATVEPIDGRTSRCLRALKTVRPMLVIGLSPGARTDAPTAPFDVCVRRPVTVQEYRTLLADWCLESPAEGDRPPPHKAS